MASTPLQYWHFELVKEKANTSEAQNSLYESEELLRILEFTFCMRFKGKVQAINACMKTKSVMN